MSIQFMRGLKWKVSVNGISSVSNIGMTGVFGKDATGYTSVHVGYGQYAGGLLFCSDHTWYVE